MHLMLVGHYTPEELRVGFHYTVGQDRVAGNLFGGHASAVAPWVRLYYQTLNDYVERGWFVGKDQNLMATMCAQTPSACVLLDPGAWPYENPWFMLWDCVITGQRHCTVH